MLRRAASAAILIAAIWVTFSPVLTFTFLNWDDNLVIVENAALAQPGVVRWAFGTMYMEHYQPFSWLMWASVRGGGAPNPAVYHALNLLLHTAVVLLVALLARTLFASGQWGQSPFVIVAALLFGLHPLRAEVVAWVSAMPYALATLLAVGCAWVWLRDAAGTARVSWFAVALFAMSLLARPLALGLPVVFAVLDHWRFARPARLSLLRAAPFAALSLAAAAVEFVARAPSAAEVPWAFRLQSALTAPFVYAWRTLVPLALTPLDVLPLDPIASPLTIGAAMVALLLVTGIAWWWRTAHPGLLVAWLAYLALLAPAVGLVPSGLQATADRYSYLPAIVLTLAAVGSLAAAATNRALARGLAVVALAGVVASAVGSRQALPHWRDSIALWSRVVDVDPNNDIGHYNLAVALAAAGQTEAAAEHYRAVLALDPAHGDARKNLDLLDAARFEREANDLAATGRLADAAVRYQAALDHDPARRHSHAALGMALVSLGREREATPHLREAIRLGDTDAAVFNTLAGVLMETGAAGEARAVLEAAMTAHPDDVTTTHNLARLLVSLPDLSPPDRLRAYRMADAVVIATDSKDARALDTLAAALARLGRMEEARRTNADAARLAAAQGDRELSAQITARGRQLKSR